MTAGSLQAAEEKGEKKKKKMKDDSSTITGSVAVTKDAGGGVSAIKLTAADGTGYKITLDEAGKKLAETDGKSTSIHGTVADAGGTQTFTVAGGGTGRKKKKKEK